MKTFIAKDGYWDEDESVWVLDGDQSLRQLDPHFEVINHSPTGFAWGYHGSGPAQLAFALLAAVIGVERARDPMLYQRFKVERIATLDPNAGWQMTEAEILAWFALADARQQLETRYPWGYRSEDSEP